MEEVQERFRFLQDSLSGGGGATTFQAEEEEERFRILQASLSGAGEATTFPYLTEPPSQMDQYQKRSHLSSDLLTRLRRSDNVSVPHRISSSEGGGGGGAPSVAYRCRALTPRTLPCRRFLAQVVDTGRTSGGLLPSPGRPRLCNRM